MEILLTLDIAQWVGLLAMALSIVVALQTNDKMLIALSFVTISLWATHFYLLGIIPAVVCNAIGAVRCLVTLKWTGWKVGIPFAIAIAIAGYFTYEAPISLLPIVASIVATMGTTLLEGVKMRLSLVVCSSCWLTHNILQGSIGGTIIEVINLCFFSYTIWRMWKKNLTKVSC